MLPAFSSAAAAICRRTFRDHRDGFVSLDRVVISALLFGDLSHAGQSLRFLDRISQRLSRRSLRRRLSTKQRSIMACSKTSFSDSKKLNAFCRIGS